ncbi:MAG: hypothetical protein ACI8ZB_005119 [Desulforhopalus sp.]|jgi:hypothetical protein
MPTLLAADENICIGRSVIVFNSLLGTEIQGDIDSQLYCFFAEQLAGSLRSSNNGVIIAHCRLEN